MPVTRQSAGITDEREAKNEAVTRTYTNFRIVGFIAKKCLSECRHDPAKPRQALCISFSYYECYIKLKMKNIEFLMKTLLQLQKHTKFIKK
jgi:hypothetical protein